MHENNRTLPLTASRSFHIKDEIDLGLDRLVQYGHVLVLSGIEAVWATFNTRAILYRLDQSASISEYQFQQPITSLVQMAEDGALGRVGSGFTTGAVAIYQLTRTDPGPVRLRWLNAHGKINSSAVTCLTWTSSRPYHLYVGHEHSAIIVYDLRLDQEYPMRSMNTDSSSEPRPSIRQRFMSRRETRKSSSISQLQTGEFRILLRGPDSGHNPIQCLASSPDPLNLARFAPDGHLLAIAQISGLIMVLDLEPGPHTISMFRTRFGAVICLSWYQISSSNQDCLLATGSQDDYISIYDVYRGICLVEYQAHTSWPTALAFISQPEANLLISVGEDRSAIVWRLSDTIPCCNKIQEEIVDKRDPAMELVANVQIDIDPIASLSIGDTDHGPIMSTISRSGRLKIWHLQTH